jgi:chaperonin GroEL (HSP60 family)
MTVLEVNETLASKKQQLQLASQVIKMILKIDDIIQTDSMADMAEYM